MPLSLKEKLDLWTASEARYAPGTPEHALVTELKRDVLIRLLTALEPLNI